MGVGRPYRQGTDLGRFAGAHRGDWLWHGIFAAEMLADADDSFEGKKVVVSGAGNVAVYAIEKVHQLGGTVIACSDSAGFVVDAEGIDLALLKDVKERRRERPSTYAAERGASSTHVPSGSIWDVPCDIALPCATQNELPADGAKSLVANGVRLVAEGANMPATPEAIAILQEAGVLFAPGKASNAGGVATSALEMQQNASRDTWGFEETEAKLAAIMSEIHRTCVDTAAEYGAPGNYVVGANLAGYIRVADAMVAQGVI